jgi:hypothetical protein
MAQQMKLDVKGREKEAEIGWEGQEEQAAEGAEQMKEGNTLERATLVEDQTNRPLTNNQTVGNFFKRRLTDFYRQHNPEKLEQVDELLLKWQGREELLFATLLQKYTTPLSDPLL